MAQQPAGRQRAKEYGDYGECNALHIALDDPDDTVLDFLLSLNIPMDQQNFDKMTPFFKLIKTKNVEAEPFKTVLGKMLAVKADVDTPDQFGVSAFWHCFVNKRYDTAFLLAKHGADLNRMDNYGWFPLKRMLFEDNREMLGKLLEMGADPNVQDEFARTVLHHAVNRSNPASDMTAVTLLLRHNARCDAVDAKGRTPLHYAFVKKNRRTANSELDPANVVSLLVKKETLSIDARDCYGKTAMHYAAQRGAL